jgi:hypothetical protein
VKTDNWIELEDPPPETTKRGPWLAVGAVVAVAIAGLLLLDPLDTADLSRGDQLPLVTPTVQLQPESPILPARAVAVAFFEAYSSFDVDTAEYYLADDADLTDFEGGETEWRAANRWLETMAYRPSLLSCDADRFPTAPGVEDATVECSFAYDLMLSEKAGLGPFRASFIFDVVSGKIARAAVLWDTQFRWQVMGPFQRWIGGNFAEDESAMFASFLHPNLDDESISLWPSRVALFAAELRAERSSEALGFVATYFDLAFAEPGPDVFQFSDFSGLPGGRENWRRGAQWFEAIGLRPFSTRCVDALRSPFSALTLRCDFEFHALGSEGVREQPYVGSFTFDFRDGMIASVDQSWLTPEFSDDVWKPIAQWVEANYPGDIPVMYTNSNMSFPRLTDQSIALWVLRVNEYVLSLDTES